MEAKKKDEGEEKNGGENILNRVDCIGTGIAGAAPEWRSSESSALFRRLRN